MISVTHKGKALMTPGKHPLAVPTQALAGVIAQEWEAHEKFTPSKMPLTSLAYTGIDQIASQPDAIVEVLLVYIDTDTLSYRSSSGPVAKLQAQQWTPILDWAGKKFGATWQVTTGVMPLEQPEALHKAIQNYLQKLDPMRLAAACVLASGLSSLVLMLAVMENHIDAAEAFRLSRLEEDSQAEQWGRDPETERRAARLKEEILTAERFLCLLTGT